MKKSFFLNELKELLEFEEPDFSEITPIDLTSIEILSVIVFVDENFNKQIKANDLKNVQSLNDLMVLIGVENFD